MVNQKGDDNIKEPKEVHHLLSIYEQLQSESDTKKVQALLKKKLKLLKVLRKKAAKEYKIKNITYEKTGFSNTYKYMGTPIEKHMKKMFEKGFKVKIQTTEGGEVQLFKTFVKVSIFGALGLIGNRTPKKVVVTYVKEPDWFQLLPEEIVKELQIYS